MIKKRKVQYDEFGNIHMTLENIIAICEQDDLYEFPELNNKLYLHFKGFKKIQNLNAFVNVKTLWLENNVITKIENLQPLKELTNLYLQNNLITQIEGLSENLKLHTLDLTANKITKIENISHLSELQTLELAQNKLSDEKSIEQLKYNQKITTLNLSNNLLKYTEEQGLVEIINENESFIIDSILKVLLEIKSSLKCLYLIGNEYVRMRQNYRKSMIAILSNLTYLDKQPVFEKERRLCDAWRFGGQQYEKLEKEKIYEEDKQKKEIQSEEVKKTIPQHNINKLKLFERSRDQLLIEIDYLNKCKQDQYFGENNKQRIVYLDQSISKKQDELVSLEELIIPLKNRVFKNTEQQNDNQQKKQQEEENENNNAKFEELD